MRTYRLRRSALPHLGPAKRLLSGRIDEAARSFPLPDYARQAVR